jgi:hypothetical protein
MHFRLDQDQFGNRLTRRFGADLRTTDGSDTAMVAKMLGPAVAYHRTLAGVSGGVHAELLLSRALYLTRSRAVRARDGWICNSIAQWSQDIGLNRREQENACRDLARIGIWEEALRGMPPRLVARVRLDCLQSLLTHGVPMAAQDVCCAAAPVCGDATSRLAQKGETSMWQPHILVSTKPHHRFDKSANLYSA